MPVITIDGKEIEAEKGSKIIQVADQNGIEIPRFCYHPDLPIAGNCRMCLVKIEKMPKLMIACNTDIADGMVIKTGASDPEIAEAVRGMLEFTLINHPIDCPVCDQSGECSLQDFYMQYGLYQSKVSLDQKVKRTKALPVNSLVVLDQERCVLCSRCVRFTDLVSKTHNLQFFQRGTEMVVDTPPNGVIDDPYSGNLIDICPVGALTNRDFRFKSRVWFLSGTDSICAGCSTGCNLRIDHNQGKLYRLVPRRNPEVNQSWLCDEGRLSFHTLEQGERIIEPTAKLNGDNSSVRIDWQSALIDLHNNISLLAKQFGGGAVAGLGSASATNETLALFQYYFNQILFSDQIDFRLSDEDQKVTVKQDQILRHLDKHPNTMGAMLLGLNKQNGLTGLLELARTGKLQALMVLYYRPLVGMEATEVTEQLAELLTLVKYSVVLSPQLESWMAGARMLLPIAAWSEEAGTYTNCNQIVQRVTAAVDPPGQAQSAFQVFHQLCQLGGHLNLPADQAETFNQLAVTVKQYQGLDYYNLASNRTMVYPPEGRHAFSQKA